MKDIDGSAGIITTVAGTGEFVHSGHGSPRNEAMLKEPDDLFLDGKGGLMIAHVQD